MNEEDPISPIDNELIIPNEINNIYLMYFSTLLPNLDNNHKKYIIDKWLIFRSKNFYPTYKDNVFFLASLMNTLKNL